MYDRSTGTKYLVDSGSVVSLLPLSMTKQKLQPDDDFQLIAVNGTGIRTYGKRVTTLNFAMRRNYAWPFIIADVKQPIIGADLLAHYGLLIDLKRGRLYDPTTRMRSLPRLRRPQGPDLSPLCSTTSSPPAQQSTSALVGWSGRSSRAQRNSWTSSCSWASLGPLAATGPATYKWS
ncbi:uncharacterized protein LOC124178224 [Neodiprion fabricii]|uniref:uncharacterized protein LOC124178224 n=1 Tax=Neodiprion fabricii TaxID=2872261 RepID=UPI001ED9479B|nr:uncharacterized protein LOC124178224 [Neodiprion fabricii]